MSTATTVSPTLREPQLLGQIVGVPVASSGDIRDQPKAAGKTWQIPSWSPARRGASQTTPVPL
jgi:hypothetical protein